MHYQVTHRTAYTYSTDVSVSHHLARLTPRSLPGQRLLSHRLAIEPKASTLANWRDYYGNETSFLGFNGAHRALVITATSQVELLPLRPPASGPPWEQARDMLAISIVPDEIAAHEFLFPSHLIPNLPALADYAAPSFRRGRAVLDAAVGLAERIYQDFVFDTKATTISTPLEQVLKNRRGVCQDFAHFYIGCLRSFGVPARYVSGYLETLPPPGKKKLVGADASHAWAQVFVPTVGWVDVDPTNNLLPSDRHITLAWGRDFDDVSPVRGVIVGGGRHQLSVGVDVAPVAA